MKRICVFSGSNSGVQPAYASAARAFGQALTTRGLGLVYGGAKVGLMGEIARAVSARGGEVIGVIPRSLMRKEVAYEELADLRVVESMHERKAVMADLADGFVAMPGGLGTLEELFEVVTWAQLGLHRKPCGIFNVNGYYDRLLAFLDHAVDQKFLKDVHRAMLMVEQSPERLLQRFETYVSPTTDKWLSRGNR
ncbi:MAG: TIGR00730 family Rossman fold protein [Candidatus Binataceae bacterium]